MFSALESQSESPDIIYVAMDRPSNDDVEFIKKSIQFSKTKYIVMDLQDIPTYVGKPQVIPDSQLFLTGHRRNQCIDLALSEGCECIIMIDGDCIPEVDLIKDHKALNAVHYPNITNGRRREEKYEWKDQREVDPKMRGADLFARGNGYVIHNPDLLRSCSVTWSCNLSINIHAIRIIKKFNKEYYGRDEVFSGEFLGRWGGEDSFLGIQAIVCKIFITMMTSDLSGIRHIDHPRPDNKYSDKAFSDHLVKEIEYLNVLYDIKPILNTFYL